MSDNKNQPNIVEDENKVLKCSIDSEFFKQDTYGAMRFRIVCYELLNYHYNNQYIVKNLIKVFSSLDKKYLEKLPFNYKEKIQKVNECLEINQKFFKKINDLYIPKFDYIKVTKEEFEEYRGFEKMLMSSFFLSCVLRDWTIESKPERDQNYGKMVRELKKYINYDDKELMQNNDFKVLVPGTGCSRMTFELAKRGFDVECNDFCYIYILFCDYLFNYSTKNSEIFCPNIDSFSNTFDSELVIKKYSFPDVDIREELKNANAKKIIFTKGDFLKLYKGQKEKYNAIITLFFIDVSKNIIEYVEIMHDLLKPGGVWINLGCLDYFYSRQNLSIDLTWDELRHVILEYGFELKSELESFVPYGVKEGKGTSQMYGTVFFTAYKK